MFNIHVLQGFVLWDDYLNKGRPLFNKMAQYKVIPHFILNLKLLHPECIIHKDLLNVVVMPTISSAFMYLEFVRSLLAVSLPL